MSGGEQMNSSICSVGYTVDFEARHEEHKPSPISSGLVHLVYRILETQGLEASVTLTPVFLALNPTQAWAMERTLSIVAGGCIDLGGLNGHPAGRNIRTALELSGTEWPRIWGAAKDLRGTSERSSSCLTDGLAHIVGDQTSTIRETTR